MNLAVSGGVAGVKDEKLIQFPKLRYIHMWDVNLVLEHLQKLGGNKLTTLSFKLVVLMALTSANRVSELQVLDLQFCNYKHNGILFKLASLTRKNQLGASLKECFFASFPGDDQLCIVQCLRHYEAMTVEYTLTNQTHCFCLM